MKPGNGKISATDRLAALRVRQASILAKIEKLERQETARARKERTRELILIGASVVADLEVHPELRETVKGMIARAASDKDRVWLQSRGWIDARRGAP